MTRTRPVAGREIGSVIGAVFGAVFVVVNSTGLTTPVRVSVVALALIALAAVLVSAFRSSRRRAAADTAPAPAPARRGTPFGRTYWFVVAVEVVALVAGTQVLTRIGLPELGVAWVAVIVGLHFFALAGVFRLRRFHVIAVLLTLAGLAGFAARAMGSTDAVALFSGVGTGLLLLGFSLWALARG